MKVRIVLFAALAMLAVGVGIAFFCGRASSGGGAVVEAGRAPGVRGASGRADAAKGAERVPGATLHAAKNDDLSVAALPEGEKPVAQTEADRREQEDRLAETFEALTDRWIKPVKGGVTMKDIDGFVAQFKKVPKARKAECLQRALNLVPDENVMLLAGILMDKSQDRALIERVYNDVLNRDEDVKKPILQQIFADKEHPCWADTAWILDVTGELPQKK